jgi:hypothetical protein
MNYFNRLAFFIGYPQFFVGSPVSEFPALLGAPRPAATPYVVWENLTRGSKSI